MPAWVAPVVAGVASTLGSLWGSNKNLKIAREQMRFQERMSSTSAQRAVEDYRKAGLNPALAYDRPASTPGGASTTIGDPVGPGLSSAQSVARMKQELRIAAEQSQADLQLKKANEEKARTEAATSIETAENLRAQRRAIDQDITFKAIQQPWDLRYSAADALLRELAIPSARNDARLSERLGEWRPAIGDILNSARAAESIGGLAGKSIGGLTGPLARAFLRTRGK